MASSNNDTQPAVTKNLDWLGVIKKDLNDISSPLGVLREKPLSCFDALAKSCLQDPQRFQESTSDSFLGTLQ